MRPVAVINPMQSRRPTGIGIAGDAVAELVPAGLARRSARLERCFGWLNDSALPGAFRSLLRLGLAQIAPWFFPREVRLVFATHQAPLWRTGRHAVVLYDTIPLQFPRQAPGQTSYYRRWLPRVVRCAERIITISAAVRDEFVRANFSAVGAATVIPAWSPALEAGGPPPAGTREARELLVVGARYPHKNIDVVLRALELLNRDAPSPWHLTLAGVDRALWAREWGGLEHFESRGWVRAIERVSADELGVLFARATVLLYPSLAEGQGLPPLEALAAGCPAICSDLPVLRETCGESVRYFPPADAASLVRAIQETAAAAGADAVSEERRRDEARVRLERFGRAALQERWREFLENWP